MEEIAITTAVSSATDRMHHICKALSYIAPAATLMFYVFTTIVSILTLQNLRTVDRNVPYRTIILLMSLILISYIIETSLLLGDTFVRGAYESSTHHNINALSNMLVWVILISTLSQDCCVWYPHYGSWLVCLLMEVILTAVRLNQGGINPPFAYLEVAVQVFRILLLVCLPLALFTMASRRNAGDEECTTLLGRDTAKDKARSSAANSTYGTVTSSTNAEQDSESDESDYYSQQDKQKLKLKEHLRSKGNWFIYLKSYLIFVPFLWPSRQPILQLHIAGVILCLTFKRALNVLEPRQLGIVLDRLNTSRTDASIKPLAFQIFLYIFYRWVWSSILGPVRRYLWVPVDQNALKALKTGAYNQIMGLSRDFHTNKRSGELYTSIGQGTSIVDILNTTLFHIVPVIVDLVVAVAYLYNVFGSYMALMIAVTAVAYFATSTYFMAKISQAGRNNTKLHRKESQVMFDSIGGWHTVTYFNRVEYEQSRYAKAVGSSSYATQAFYKLYYFSSAMEETVIDFGLAGAALLAIYQIAHAAVPVGSFVMLMSYWGNFTGNLSYLVSMQRQLLRNLIDAEALLHLFHQKPTVKDGSKPFRFRRGAVEFANVKFSYDGEKDIIQETSFRAEPGQRIALVGETGGGKSTILKLLFRLYDVTQGSIRIDDQDLRDLTFESLRDCIGVVPQDPSMFNGTIMENVRYSRPEATNDKVIEACKAAAVHDKIESFSKSYASRVGEGGVKLSGGELQRIAIARVILKDPKIVLLDEATSAVDSETEARIQEALERMTRGRTTFTVAHRLSTVTNSDVILVIKEGRIVEKGSPVELIAAKGRYHDLWLRQIGVINAPEKEKTTKFETVNDQMIELSGDAQGLSEGSFISQNQAFGATGLAFDPTSDPPLFHQPKTDLNDSHSPLINTVLNHQKGLDGTNVTTIGKSSSSNEAEAIKNASESSNS